MAAATLIVGGQSELTYLRTIWHQLHPWADLSSLDAETECASGDSQIPALVEQSLQTGRCVFVLLDRDALARAHEQAPVIQHDDVEPFELHSDFEAAFDPEVMQIALSRLGYTADTHRLSQARISRTPFADITARAEPLAAARALGKVQLAEALAQISAETWYVPVEIYRAAIRFGELCGVGAFSREQRWIDADAPGARGRLYVCNHVSNDSVRYFDFERRETGSIALPDTFGGSVSIARGGTRFVATKHVRRAGASLPIETWVHVIDFDGSASVTAERFRVRGSVYEARVDEDGNHLTLLVQEDGDQKRAFRCLTNGTQRGAIGPQANPGFSPNRQRMVMPSHPLRVMIRSRNASGEPRAATELTLPHFGPFACTWSSCSRYLAFFGRRWGKSRPGVTSQDCLWILDVQTQTVSRLAFGDQFIPTYWT